jgi:putative exporter of polyketide antibiotics
MTGPALRAAAIGARAGPSRDWPSARSGAAPPPSSDLAAGMTALVAATYPQVMADPAAAGSLQALAGWAPRWTGPLGSVPATGGFLLLVIAESIAAPDWIRDISPFTHLTPVPLAQANTTASAVMLATATLLAVPGVAAYRRRDLLP